MRFYQWLLLLGGFALINSSLWAQSMEKKFRTIKAELQINASAERVWQAMVLDYGEIANFSPYIYASNYENGSLKGELGAERKCNFNEKGTRWSHERIMDINYEDMVMRNAVIDAGKFPLDQDNSQAYYRVQDNGDGTCTASYEFQFRTKPAFMGGLAKGSFAKTLAGTLVGLRHYVETGEKVNAENERYDEIKERYPEPSVMK
ncbi:MAG: SRPBCC family protein [Bacteroidota bacterium]